MGGAVVRTSACKRQEVCAGACACTEASAVHGGDHVIDHGGTEVEPRQCIDENAEKTYGFRRETREGVTVGLLTWRFEHGVDGRRRKPAMFRGGQNGDGDGVASLLLPELVRVVEEEEELAVVLLPWLSRPEEAPDGLSTTARRSVLGGFREKGRGQRSRGRAGRREKEKWRRRGGEERRGKN